MTLAEAYRQSALIQSAYDMLGLTDPHAVALPEGFKLIEILTANDFGMGVRPFGLIAQDQVDGLNVVALRGSAILRDWLENARFLMRQAPGLVGRTELGFTAVFDSLATLSGRAIPPIARGLAHSLGCTVLTYLAGQLGGMDLALLASPEPGDAQFGVWALSRLAGLLNVQNPHDDVPDAPGRFLGYRDVGKVTALPFGYALAITPAEIDFNHELTNYRVALQAAAAQLAIAA